MQKLNCVIIDDEESALRNTVMVCDNTPFVKIVGKFLNPNEFLKKNKEFDFDLCILDIDMPEMDGVQLARLLVNKMVIFVTGEVDKIKDAVDIHPIGVIKKTRMDGLKIELEKALKLKGQKKYLFNIKGKVNKIGEQKQIDVSDIFYIITDTDNHRNKKICLKTGECIIIMDYTFEDLMELSSDFVKVNKSEVISVESVDSVHSDIITLKYRFLSDSKMEMPRNYVSLSKECKDTFNKCYKNPRG